VRHRDAFNAVIETTKVAVRVLRRRWPALAVRTGGSPYAKAFLTLVEELGIAPRRARTPPDVENRTPAEGQSRVRVLAVAE
jgi:hypothetical protein